MTFQIYSQENAPAQSRDGLARAQSELGYVPDLLGVFAQSPALLNSYIAMDDWMKKSSFDATEREVVLKTAAHMSNCSWCASAVLNEKGGAPPEVSRAAEQGLRIDDACLEALRQYTIGVMDHRGRPTDEAIEKFLEAGYGPQQALEIVLAAGMMTMAAMAASLAHRVLESRVRH